MRIFETDGKVNPDPYSPHLWQRDPSFPTGSYCMVCGHAVTTAAHLEALSIHAAIMEDRTTYLLTGKVE